MSRVGPAEVRPEQRASGRRETGRVRTEDFGAIRRAPCRGLESSPTWWERCSKKAGVMVGRLTTEREIGQRRVIQPARQAGLDKTGHRAQRERERRKAWWWGGG